MYRIVIVLLVGLFTVSLFFYQNDRNWQLYSEGLEQETKTARSDFKAVRFERDQLVKEKLNIAKSDYYNGVHNGCIGTLVILNLQIEKISVFDACRKIVARSMELKIFEIAHEDKELGLWEKLFDELQREQ